MDDALLIDRPRAGVLLLTLNRPESLNAFDMALAARFEAALADAADDEAVRCVVLTGAGRAFSSGNDIHEMAGFDADGMLNAFLARDPIIWQVASLAKPVICALNGITYGAGALIAAAADIRIGSPTMKFKVTASNYGGANATWTLPRVVGVAKAKEILMMGRAVGAEEALAIGLLNHIVDDPLGAALDMAEAIAANPPEGVAGVKALIDGADGKSLLDAFNAEFAWMIEATRHGAKGGGEMFEGFLAKSKRTPG
ncbi:enoyl-CoA hydratase/isomerase family protein [Sphingomonas sp. CGMCC 1.13654]|uniref:Enoyl-CoA hydratase/isomerase family protein n=1 Tax=Sphingomonas chungangi TaxID=2683589 RepID=A0A838L479_9SPHN|nr:enoyl-CoA hydratase/isomerase family protein [Sphingomonas chungangi]MBA2933847.1 enoyl-CoA hydratase/isomerase family protein [Sphingomonas chungangi]MVW55177.1 enoyl-CoA hydratase/isomerase family protein [Sphingomonas chungangi]